MLCKITKNILCADNISSWSRPKPASDDLVKNGELTGHNTSPKHHPNSPAHRNKERLKDTEVLTNARFTFLSPFSLTFQPLIL